MADQPGDTMRERADENSWLLWTLLDADRWLVTALLSAALFCSITIVGSLVSGPGFQAGDPIETLYQALITSTVTGVTLVLTLSQLVLSQELGSAGDQHERMQGALSFRREVADAVGTAVSPAEPSAFLRVLVTATRDRAEAIDDAAANLEPDARDRITSYLDAVIENADGVIEQLDGATFGEFDVVRAALNYNYSWKLYEGRSIHETDDIDLPEAAVTELESLLGLLELFGPAREHFKTLYFQWELSNLSRTLLYTAVPALAVAVSSLLFLDPSAIDGTTAGIDHALVLVAATTTVSLVPFTILLAYVLRIVTVTKRTLSIGPFILRETDRSADVSERT